MKIKTFISARLLEEVSVDGFALRAAVAQHDDRSMVVTWQGHAETITRCGMCAKEATTPCRALKVIAARYDDHADFDREWLLTTAE